MGTFEDLKTKAGSEGNYKLTADIVATERIVVTANVTLDLNGHSITKTVTYPDSSDTYIFGVNTDVEFTLKNTGNSGEVKSTLVGDTSNSVEAGVIFVQNGSLVLDNVKISGTAYGIVLFTSSNLIATNSQISTTNYPAISGNGSSNPAEAELSDCRITSANSVAIYWPSSGNLYVNGGEISGAAGISAMSGSIGLEDVTITVNGNAFAERSGRDGPPAVKAALAAFGNSAYFDNIEFEIYNDVKINAKGYPDLMVHHIEPASGEGFDYSESEDGLSKNIGVLFCDNNGDVGISLNAASGSPHRMMLDLSGLSKNEVGIVGDTDIDNVSVDTGSKLRVSATLTGSVEGSGDVILQNGDVSGAEIDSTITIVDESDDSARKTITWKDGEIDYYADGSNHIIGANQIINIEGKVVLVSGSKLVIAGKLVVPAGAELVIESGAALGFYTGATLVVEGTLTIEGEDEDEEMDAGILALYSAFADISGNLTVNGVLGVTGASSVTFKQDSSVLVAAGGVLSVEDGNVVVDDSAVLTVNGLAYTEDGVSIKNKGTVVIDSSDVDEYDLTISNVAVGAVVDVVKFTGNGDAAVIVDDEGLVYTTYRDSVEKRDVSVTDDKITVVVIVPDMVPITTGSVTTEVTDYVASVSGVKIVSVTSSENKTGDSPSTGLAKGKQWSKSMDISGNVSAAYAAAVETPTTANPKAEALVGLVADSKGFAVAGELALGDNIELIIAYSDEEEPVIGDATGTKVIVTGTVTAVKTATITNNGEITVSGEGEVSDVEGIVANTVSTLYVTSVKDSSGNETKTNHYVNIDKALVIVNNDGSEVKKLTLQNAQTVKVSASLPEGVTLELNGKALAIDSKDNVTLEIVKGAAVPNAAGSKIVVGGTLYAQDKTNVKVADIKSDVYTEEIGDDGKAVKNGWAKWTNLSSALADSKSGEKITLNNEVTLENNTTVPEGVTLDAGDFNIKLADGVTLTVNGILTTDADILAQSAFATEAKKVSVEGSEAYSSAVVVNGKLISSNAIAYVYSEAATESGDEEFTDAVKLTEKSVIAGAYYESKDGSHVISSMQIAQDEFATISSKITVNGAVTAGDLAFAATEDCTEIVIGNDSHTILTVSSLTLSGMTLTVQGQVTGAVVVGDAAVDMKKASGIIIESNDSKLVFTGTVTGTVTVSKGTVYGNATINNSDKTMFTVASGATLEVKGAVTVNNIAINGIVNVPSGKTLTVNVNADIAGAVTVAPATDSKEAGHFIAAGALYMGISADDLETGAAASFSGPVEIGSGKKIVVSADASVDDAFKASVKSYKNTEFYVQGSLWFTAYANGTASIEVSEIPVENVKLVGWSKTEGGEKVTADDFTYTIGSPSKLYALIETQVYEIIIKADEGIDNVYLDGQLMTYGMIRSDDSGAVLYYAYSAVVAAGDHKVTYTLKNGYSGEATLYSDGKAVAGNTIKSTGDFSAPSVFTLSGIQKSGYVDPTPVTPSEDKDDGMTITDYLLIVLVVLIVIMAVIVAMRLMRS